MRFALVALAIVIGSAGIAAAVTLKPSGFERCMGVMSADIERQAAQTATTLDPRDIELSAARLCAGITE